MNSLLSKNKTLTMTKYVKLSNDKSVDSIKDFNKG
jgi:hypothetical protein